MSDDEVGLRESEFAGEPVEQFGRWLADARTVGDDVDTMVVATADATGSPSARVVLLRGVDRDGFRFYTNYDSEKGADLAANPRAALCWHWPTLGRQVRVTGGAARVSVEDSRAYWNNRPRASRVSAWASRQSEPIADRAALEAAAADVDARFRGDDVPLPPFWGGYLVTPDTVEFWQHRDDRLHDRLRYRRDRSGWILERLQP